MIETMAAMSFNFAFAQKENESPCK